jgi:hypothetical protein
VRMILAPNRRIHKLANVPAKPASSCAGIQKNCVVPVGVYKGEPAEPSAAQRNIVRQVYGSHDAELLIQDPVLGAYLAPIHTCGIRARGRFRPKLNVDAGTVRDAAGPTVRAGVKREPNGVRCPGLDTHDIDIPPRREGGGRSRRGNLVSGAPAPKWRSRRFRGNLGLTATTDPGRQRHRMRRPPPVRFGGGPGP